MNTPSNPPANPPPVPDRVYRRTVGLLSLSSLASGCAGIFLGFGVDDALLGREPAFYLGASLILTSLAGGAIWLASWMAAKDMSKPS